MGFAQKTPDKTSGVFLWLCLKMTDQKPTSCTVVAPSATSIANTWGV